VDNNLKKTIDKFLKGRGDYLLAEGDCIEVMKLFPKESIDCAITSPPYWKQRQYHNDRLRSSIPLGDELSHEDYVKNLVRVFSELKRVLKKSGSFWLNLGDKYYNKNLMGMPWRVAIAMQEDGWILRNDIVWDQMKGTQSSKDRLRDIYEHVFHFVKNKKYYYSHKEIRIIPTERARNKNGIMISVTGVSGKKYFEQIKTSTHLSETEKKNALLILEETIEEMRRGEVIDFRMTIRGQQRTFHSDNKAVSGRAKELDAKGFFILKMRSSGYLPSDIWRIVPEDMSRKDAHYAVFPEKLLLIPIKATCPDRHGIVLDPFSGTGSTVSAALRLKKRGLGIELSSFYNTIAEKRIKETIQKTPSFAPLE